MGGVVTDLSDRFKAGIEAFVNRIISRYEYAFIWSYEVVAQNADDTLELKPDVPSRVPGLSKVPVIWGDAGVTATVRKGARCFVSFVNGDPSMPRVLGFEHGSYTAIKAGDDGLPTARQGDLVQCGGPGTVLTIMPTAPIPVVTPTGPGSIVPMTPILGLVSFSAIPPTGATADPLYGTVSTGSSINTAE
jgi:hypothetical protein